MTAADVATGEKSATAGGRLKPGSISHPETSRRVLDVLEPVVAAQGRVADVGCGRGHFSAMLLDALESRGTKDAAAHVFPVDAFPQYFEIADLECRQAGADGRVPLDDAAVDAAVSIEVIEHVEDQFAFVRELARITRPGGLVVVSTPNVHHVSSRLRSLLWGFPQLYDPLPLSKDDPRFLGGHVHPIHPYFLCYVAHRAGLVVEDVLIDRRKSSAKLAATLLAPFTWLGQRHHRARLRRRDPERFAENRAWLDRVASWDLATGRTAILVARKPEA
ncbi:MAG: class I SAM-dependent methyltransferase [Planctomycetota bacterium]